MARPKFQLILPPGNSSVIILNEAEWTPSQSGQKDVKKNVHPTAT